MTDIYENAPTYVCAGCESEMPDPKNVYLKKYGEFEACPLCMTLDELWELKYGAKK
jgi:hypothetical protein